MNKACFGISSKTNDGKHIILLDYDNIGKMPKYSFLEIVVHEIKEIQKDFYLSHFYILDSKNGFNALCLDKVYLNEIRDIANNKVLIDEQYIRIGYNRGYYALRIGPDKRYIRMVINHNGKIKSNSHRLFFNSFFSMNINKTNLFDNNTGLEIIAYESKKHGYMEI